MFSTSHSQHISGEVFDCSKPKDSSMPPDKICIVIKRARFLKGEIKKENKSLVIVHIVFITVEAYWVVFQFCRKH